ncbi:MAG: sigma-70 family RNA polymerase sigma factor [Candidatus Hydrogenedentes bacterium]|nr:sigma-70 family RNA polymerase sigma factor [Candidatus Hydrogenedentota bacterium]
MTDLHHATDAVLLQCWRQDRNAEAFAELVHRYSALTYTACRRVLGSDGQAEEVAQECFLALAALHPKNARSLGAWLHRVATNRAINRLRSESRRRHREDAFARTRPHADTVSWDDLQPHIDAAINALPDRLRGPIVLHFLEGKSHQECAAVLGIPRTTLSSRIARGVDEIRAHLGRKGITLSALLLTELLANAKAGATPPLLTAALGKLALSGPPAAASFIPFSIPFAATRVLLPLLLLGLGAGFAFNRYTTHNAPPAPDATPVIVSTAAPGTPQPSPATIPATPAQQTPQSPITAPPDPPADSRPLADGFARIHGHIRSTADLPVERIQIDVSNGAGFQGGGAALTDAGGNYAIDVEPAPLYYVAARRSSPDLRTAETVLETVEAGRHYRVDLVAYAGEVSGVVVNAAGQALPEAQIMAAPVTPWHFGLPTARANAAGRFTVQGLHASAFKFHVQLGEGDWRDVNTSIELAANETVQGLRLVYPDLVGRTIAGIVVDPDGQPIDHARVEAHLLPGYTNTDSAWSGPDGTFMIEGLEEGEYLLQTAHRAYSSIGGNRVTAGSDSCTLVMAPRGGIEGAVVDAVTRRPIPRFEVYRAVPVSDSHPDSVQWDWHPEENAQGHFTVTDLPQGEFNLAVRATGYVEGKIPVTVAAGQTLSDLLVALKPGTPLRGEVVDTQGEAVVGALLFDGPLPDAHDRDRLAVAKSGAQGHFEIAAFDPALKQLTAWHYNYTHTIVPVNTVDAPLNVVLDPGARITGQVLHNGAPVEGASLSLLLDFTGATPRPLAGTRTDGDGRFILEHAPREGATLVAALPKSQPDDDEWTQCLALSLGEAKDRELTVQFQDYDTALRIAVTADGKAQPGLYYTLAQAGDPAFYYNGHTSSSGHIDVTGLPPGAWQLALYPAPAPGVSTVETLNVDLREGEDMEEELAY